jgi:hypothetical protein
VSEQDPSLAAAGAPPVGAAGPDVHRLLDMVVEEVSLVDRPANKRRFLVVKRETEMATKDDADVEKKKKAPSKEVDVEEESDSAKPPKKPGAKRPLFPPKGKKKKPLFGDDAKTAKAFPPKKKDPEEEDDDASDDEDDGKKKPAKKDAEGAGPPEDEAEDEETPLEVALAALDSLTQAVESLSDSPAGGPELAAVAQDIRQAADAIAEAAGVEAEDEAAEAAAEGEGESDPTTMATLLSSIQEMLTRLESLTQAISATKAPAPHPVTPATTSPELAGTLSEVSQSLKSMDALLKAQAARLETLEKRAGVPNSQPAGEAVAKAAPSPEPSWPMDMNRPRDRASVDKSVSFYPGERE